MELRSNKMGISIMVIYYLILFCLYNVSSIDGQLRLEPPNFNASEGSGPVD